MGQNLYANCKMEGPKQDRRFGVDPVLGENHDPPYCPHGPTLLFRRYYSDREARQFYACAVHRDRKGCSFFHWEDEKLTKEKRDRWMKIFTDQQHSWEKSARVLSSLPSTELHYCTKCGMVLLEKDLSTHDGHGVIQALTDSQLQDPTTLLSPMDDRKSQAQFFFSDSSLHLIYNELKRLNYTKVLCIGTPRLHGLLMKHKGIKSLLLDIDHRYVQFYAPHQYQRYNMFNHFFYSSDGLKVCQQFLSESPDTIAIVVDPPFGGIAQLLAMTIRKLWEVAGTDLATFLVFPYFLESHVISSLPSLWMMDYQVTYLNHKHFGAARKKSKPSPVRIFTNLPVPGFRLPTEEGYRLCKSCSRYVARLNFHCENCGTCTSKDGQPYFHCDICEKCVKQSWAHCSKCSQCQPPQHTCGTRVIIGCHICGSLEHKRKDCPTKEKPPKNKKRKDCPVREKLPPRKKRRTSTEL